MNRTKVMFVTSFLFAIIIIVVYYIHALDTENSVRHGKIDLSRTDFHASGVIELNGEWEFYWGQFLGPADFTDGPRQSVRYLNVPGNWLRDQEGASYPRKGFATYRLSIHHIPNTGYFGLKKANIRNASRIYVNGELVLEDGRVSTQSKESIGGNNSKVVYFELKEPTAEIIVQVSNYDYIVGGIAKPILFGTQDQLANEHIRKVMFESAMILVVLIIGLFYLFLYIASRDYRKREPVTLPLAFSCLAFGVMNGIYSERVITILIPKLTLDSTFRFGHFISAISIIMVVIVIHKVNPVFISRSVRNVLLIFYGLFMVFVITLPLGVYTSTLTFYMLVTVVLFFFLWLWIFVLFFKSSKHSRNHLEHSALIVSVFCIFLYWLDMILYSLGIKTDMLLSFLTLSVYSIAFMILLIVRYTHSYKKNEELSIQLIETFSTLDQTAKEAQRNELAFLQAQIKPHFLFNALSSIISLCYTNGERAGKLLTELSNYLRRSFAVDLKADFITLENELKLIEAFVEIEKARFGPRIRVRYNIDPDVLPLQITPLVIEPLVENAIRHGVLKNKQGGVVKLTIKQQPKTVYICVEDNGKGIDREQIERIQQGESNLNASQGNGISLRNVYTRLRNVYDVELNFEITGDGTKVYFTIPIQASREEGSHD